MTGFGRAEKTAGSEKFTIELRSLNGKSSDISVKSQIIPREKELEVRQYLSKTLIRGNIDLFVTIEYTEKRSSYQINRELLLDYFQQVKEIRSSSLLSECDDTSLLSTLLRLPDVIENKKNELDSESWEILFSGIEEAAAALLEYREKEGLILEEDILKRVALIESYILEVEKYEPERSNAIKERLRSKISDLGIPEDMNRLEQEIIFYIEKLDITEEKVRLRQHCSYFLETVKEENPGRKLAFISQEMGREINTMGSKANHAEIQRCVVKMKDELEKIKEQLLNAL